MWSPHPANDQLCCFLILSSVWCIFHHDLIGPDAFNECLKAAIKRISSTEHESDDNLKLVMYARSYQKRGVIN